MVHKIHRGKDLESVEHGKPYYIVGFNQTVIDFSQVDFPQDIKNCLTCHKGPQGDNYKTSPSGAACGSCHDNVNPNTGKNHEGGAQPDSNCKKCHTPSGREISIMDAHDIGSSDEHHD